MCYDLSSASQNGEFLTRDESRASYAIIRHNIRTYESAGVVGIVKGRQNAEASMKEYEDGQSSEDRRIGWRYFLERSELAAGTDPEEATKRRDMDLDFRESEARLPAVTPSTGK